MDWGWPLIAAAFTISGVGTAFLRHAAGMRIYPRRLRLRLELEDALFLANRFARNGRDGQALSERLLSAERLSRRTLFGERITRLAHAQSPGELDARVAIADELHAIVEQLSPEAGGRFPLRFIGMLPQECILPFSAAVAIAGVVIEPLSPATPLLSSGRLLGGLVLFGLASAMLRLIRLISLKIHDIRSKASFRIMLVSDKTTLTKIGAAAVAHLYWRIGHLVMLLGDDKLESQLALPPGVYSLALDRLSFADALTAYGEGADLIVLDTDDEILAAEIKALTKLPTSRYLALSANGVAPHGYQWVDPRCLFIFPSDKRARRSDGDSYLLGIRVGRSLWNDLIFQIELFASALFAFIERGMPLALFLALAAFSQILPDELGPRRRVSIARSTLRVPRSLDASHRLVPQKLEARLWIGTILVALFVSIYLEWPIHIDWHAKLDASIFKLSGLLSIVLLACNSIVWTGLVVRKWWLDWNFRFLVLRRNSRTFGYGHKAFVMSTCGKYGQVFSLQDFSLDQTDDDYGEWRESSLGSWFRIFSEIGNTLKPDAFLHNWQRQVILELETADFAVFDWVEEVTDNMKWELCAALERLPAHRLLVICSPATQEELNAFLASRALPEGHSPRSILTSRGRDDKYIWADHSDFDKAFSVCLHQLLEKLVVEPRTTTKREGTGAWPYPRKVNTTDEICSGPTNFI